MANQTAPGRELQLGWVDSPNQRGTIDIIWSCLLVLFTGTWSVLHVNLPAEGEGYWSIFNRKARWFIFAIGSPEVITILASTQRMSARYSVPKMHSIGVSHWTPVHGFFADSGGFVLHPPDTPPFPVNSRALYYLIEKKYLEPPSLTKQDILDRSKFDRFAKAVAIVQSMYMICSCISRAAQSLAITLFELFTLAFVVCTATSFYFWMDKPLGVESAVHLRLTIPMATILTEAGPAASQPYADTPMDFVEQPGWRVFSRIPLFTSFGGIDKRPLKRIPNDYIEEAVSFGVRLPQTTVALTHAAIHLCGWNFAFPTRTEQFMWRWCSIVLIVVLVLTTIVHQLSSKHGMDFSLAFMVFWEKKCAKNTFNRRWLVRGFTIWITILYFLARVLLIGETLASLRLMPSSAFQTVNWTDFWPHV